MEPLTAGLITGGASLLGSFFSSDTAAKNTQAQIAAQQGMQQQTENFNASQAQIQRDYQTQMSNTAYQRASQDMQKAGLNPAMMFGSGSAASSPGGASASVSTPTPPVSQSRGALSGLGEAVSKGVDAAVSAKTLDRMTQEIANLKTAALKTEAETETEKQRPALVSQERRLQAERAEATRVGAASDRQEQILRGPKTLEAAGVMDRFSAAQLGKIGAIKYGAGTVGDIVGPIVSSAIGAGRVGQAFSAIADAKLKRAMDRGNFIGKYGTPIDEYLSH